MSCVKQKVQSNDSRADSGRVENTIVQMWHRVKKNVYSIYNKGEEKSQTSWIEHDKIAVPFITGDKTVNIIQH